MDCETAYCPKCKRDLPRSSFNKDTARRRGLQSVCKDCKRELNGHRYAHKKDQLLEENRVRKGRYKRQYQKVIQEAKDRSCADCGKWYPSYVMDFHHRPGTVKAFEISQWRGRRSNTPDKFEELYAEIAKCLVLCSNCHRERHYGPATARDEIPARLRT